MLSKKLLWIDCLGALAAGAAMLVFSSWLSGLYGFSRQFVVGLAAVNLAYGSFSLSLAARRRRPPALIALLALANLAWGLVCFAAAIHLSDAATPFGLAHLVLEGLYVGGLGALEWKWRRQLVSAD